MRRRALWYTLESRRNGYEQVQRSYSANSASGSSKIRTRVNATLRAAKDGAGQTCLSWTKLRYGFAVAGNHNDRALMRLLQEAGEMRRGIKAPDRLRHVGLQPRKTNSPFAKSTLTAAPSWISPATSFLASGVSTACCRKRFRGRAP